MKIISKVLKFIYDKTQKGFYFLCLVFSRGFYYYFYLLAIFFKKIFRNSKFFDNLVNNYRSKQERPEHFFLVVFSCILLFVTYFVVYIDCNDVVKLENNIIEDTLLVEDKNDSEEQLIEKFEKVETNLFKIYGNKNISEINFSKLKENNNDVVLWIMVDGTNINYPVVKTDNNDYYLYHDINNNKTNNGWPFIDYRNDSNMIDDNTIFYGHNLLNKTSFGSISNLFTTEWFNTSNRRILILTETMIYTYEIFSVYYSDPVSYYLQTNFSSNEKRVEFYNDLASKSSVSFSNSFVYSDKIITLSTCTDDNNGRQVVHAKLISEGSR